MAGVLACPEPPAAAAAHGIFEQGGGALDAAVAAAFAQGVSLPLGCGVAGMAHILVTRAGWPAPRFLNASVAVGARGRPEVFQAGFRGRSERAGRYLIEGDRNQFGYESIMTPGFVRGMEAVHGLGSRRLPWAALVSPAAEIAERGFEVYPYLARYYTFEGPDRPGYPDVFRKLRVDATASALLLPRGRPIASGETLRQPGYARTLARLAGEGPDSFYRGAIASQMADDFDQHGALVTGEDLAEYAVQHAAPVAGEFRDLTVYSSPPPGHGIVLVSMLNLVEPIDLARLGWNTADYVATIAWATRTAFGDCMPYLADPNFVAVPLEWLGSKTRAREAQHERAPERSCHAWTSSNEHTTHVSSADASGDVVSITHSIGSIAGAGVMTRDLGFLYNNFMGHFNPLPGYHNSIAPLKRMGGGSPAIVYRAGVPWLAIGSSGGSRLISAVFQTLLNVIVFGMTLQEAVAAPRVHCEEGRRIYVEPALAPLADTLRGRGYEIEVTGYMGCNQAVEITSAGLAGGSDPRGGQAVAYWPGR